MIFYIDMIFTNKKNSLSLLYGTTKCGTIPPRSARTPPRPHGTTGECCLYYILYQYIIDITNKNDKYSFIRAATVPDPSCARNVGNILFNYNILYVLRTYGPDKKSTKATLRTMASFRLGEEFLPPGVRHGADAEYVKFIFIYQYNILVKNIYDRNLRKYGNIRNIYFSATTNDGTTPQGCRPVIHNNIFISIY